MDFINLLEKKFSLVCFFSETERIEFCRIMFLILANSFDLGNVSEVQTSAMEKQVLGNSFSSLIYQEYTVKLAIKWGDRLVTAKGELKQDADLSQLKVINISI